MIVTHPTRTVYTVKASLVPLLNGLTNQKGTASIIAATDPDGNPIVGKQVLDDPDYDYLEGAQIADPDNPTDKRLIRDWLVEIPHKYEDGE